MAVVAAAEQDMGQSVGYSGPHDLDLDLGRRQHPDLSHKMVGEATQGMAFAHKMASPSMWMGPM